MCKFCESYESWMRVEEFDEEDERLGKRKREISVAMVIRSWYEKRGKRNSGSITDYRYRGCGYKLNYCPECGRKLNVHK